MSFGHPREDIEDAMEYMSLEFRKKVQTGDKWSRDPSMNKWC